MGLRERIALTRRSKTLLSKRDDVIAFARHGFELFIIKEFISKADCAYLKAMTKNDLQPSRTLGGEHPSFSDFRTSSTSNLDQSDSIVNLVETSISNLLGIESRNGEGIQGQYYTQGQTFKPHCDFLQENEEHWKTARREGGQRVWTAMAYLDEGMQGGETRFVKAGFNIKPVTGMLVLWANMNDDGYPDYLTLHEAAPIISGEKTVLTKWYRERKFERPRNFKAETTA
ncbi:MAG: 2OG-Fe(II) oxygenase [Erythrobacter sp.]|jgi:prolyl 4-hydroxylase|nr:2OG-Fe(II) oxygenase [Erythrobacter sp.]